MRDSYGREINYLRVSVTDRCNLRCLYCMPASGVRLLRHEDILSYERMAEVVRAAAALGFEKVRLTGGEPLARKGLVELVSLIAQIPGIRTLGMTTNGTMLAPLAAELRRRGLDSVNVSLDTLDPERYRRITRGGNLQDAIDGVRAAVSAGFPVKINVVMLEDTTGEEFGEIETFAAGLGARVQTIARYSLAEEKRDGGEYDRPPPCAECNRLRLLANGILRPCLHGSGGVPVDFSDIGGSIEKALLAKPARGLLCRDLEVGQIGG
ncbi:MAG: GTP 3',8-cyclase MoaA [Rectinemataceae bacterium]